MTNQQVPLRGVFLTLLLIIFGLCDFPYGLSASVAAQSQPQGRPLNADTDQDNHDNHDKDVLIHFHADTSTVERQTFINTIPGQLLSWIEPLHVAKVRVPSDFVVSGDIVGGDIVNGASPSVLVETIEADGMVYGMVDPNDPDLQDVQRTYAPELLGLNSAWDYTMGSSEVVVAVLDTGITSAHPEFAGRILDGYDFYNNDDDPEDDHGHGTHVSGTVAAAINNGIGSAGLCGRCSLLPVKVLNQNNAGTWSGVASGIIYAADNGAHIIVMSLGSTSGTQVVEDAIAYAISKDVMIIAAAGNANSNREFYPAAYDGVIGVAATNRDDERWVLSNYGSYIDISAPGHVIYSTYKDLTNSYSGHVFMSGTSMATPHVGGLAGLIKSQNTARTSADITEILLNSALDLGDPGKDDYFGMGRIDPPAALAYNTSDPKTAILGGTVWRDADADGTLEVDELVRIPDITIQLYNSNNQAVGTTNSGKDGTWRIANLAAGSYRLAVTTGNLDLIWTNPTNANVTLAAGQSLTSKAIGFAEELPADVVSEIGVYRRGSDVTINWEITSDLVMGLNLERSIDNSEYEVVKQFDLSLPTTARSTQSFSDTLPEGTEDADVSYRMQVTPGGNYLDSIPAPETPGTVILPTPIPSTSPTPSEISGNVIFLPWVATR